MKRKILAISQCFSCGSWLSIEKITNKLSENKNDVTVLGYGTLSARRKDQRYFLIPYFAYNRYGYITCYSPILGFLWNLPLYLFSLFITIWFQPRTILYNGLGLGLVLSPVNKLLGRNNIIMYHSTIKGTSSTNKKIIKFLMLFVDLVVVNSKGSKDDFGGIYPEKMVVINEHYAPNIYFAQGKKSSKIHKTLKILYVGRIDRDKQMFPLIEFARKMKKNPDFEFIFAGAGSDINKIKNATLENPRIKFLGYVSSSDILSKLYREADVLWTFADRTYLGLPAVEALACDTPIIVPRFAAIAGSKELVDEELVPSEIGWVVNTSSSKEVERLMNQIGKNKEYMEKRCYEYAKIYYSDKNLAKTIERIEGVMNL